MLMALSPAILWARCFGGGCCFLGAGLAFVACALPPPLLPAPPPHLQLLSKPSRLARQQGLVPSLSDEELDVSMEVVFLLPSFGDLGRVVGSFLNSALGDGAASW